MHLKGRFDKRTMLWLCVYWKSKLNVVFGVLLVPRDGDELALDVCLPLIRQSVSIIRIFYMVVFGVDVQAKQFNLNVS